MTRSTRRTRRAGFTLIEMLIVMVVLGILAAIAIPRMKNVRQKGFLSAMRSDLENFALVQESYFSDYHAYATTTTDLDNHWTRDVFIHINEHTNSGWAATATHPGLQNENCGMYYGTGSPANATPATTAGAVYCTTQ